MRKGLLVICATAAMIGLAGCGSAAPTRAPEPEATTAIAEQAISTDQEKLDSVIAETPYICDIVTSSTIGVIGEKVTAFLNVNDIGNLAFGCDFITNYIKQDYPDMPAEVTVKYQNGDDFLSWHSTDLEKGFLSAPGSSVPDVTIQDMYDYTNGDSGESTTEAVEDEDGATIGQINALNKAGDYLEYTAFSKKGLRSQLEYEGFKDDEIDYAIENCGADWKEQAVKKAKEYLEFSSFSKESLIEQLEYEGFTEKQAKYGADEAYK